MSLQATIHKSSRSLNASLSPRAGGGGRVVDVTYNNESVVNEQGVAIIPPYPEIPTVPVKDVTYNGASVVNAQGTAVIPVVDAGNKITYGTTKPTNNASNGDVYYLLDDSNKLMATYLYMQNVWRVISGSVLFLQNVLKSSQRNYSIGASTFTASKDGYVLCFNQNMNGEASTQTLTSTFTTNATLISENDLSENYNAPNRNHDTKIAIYHVTAGDTITFSNVVNGGYTTQLHLAFYIPDGYTITREDFKAQSDGSMGTTLTKSLTNGLYFSVVFESSGQGTANNKALCEVSGGDYRSETIYDVALIGCSVALMDSSYSITYTWASTTSYVTRGYVIYKLTEVV